MGARRAPDAALRNVEEVTALERSAAREQSTAERVGTAITNAAGTGTCAALHVCGLAAWVGWNTLARLPWRFDPYPFGLLTMWVSMEGVLLAVLVLITQNRMSRQSDRRDHLDLQVDLLAEQEMTMVLRMLRRIADRLGVESSGDEAAQTDQLMERTDIRKLMDELARRFP